MIRSTVKLADCQPGDVYAFCRRWLDGRCDFEQVRVLERRRSRVAVELLSGPEQGETASPYASALWPADEISRAREFRQLDMRIRALDEECPSDTVTETAVEVCCLLISGDTYVYDPAITRGLLRRLGRPDDLNELHELAYIDDNSSVVAPDAAWRDLYAELAAAEPQLIDERAAEAVSGFSWLREDVRDAALRMVRGWADLPTIRPGDGQSGTPDEVSRLRALVELAADALDDAGRPDQALNIRRAAFPHRFSVQDLT